MENFREGKANRGGGDIRWFPPLNKSLCGCVHNNMFLIQEAEALGHKDKLRMLKSRKLALIVDLDQTLIHTSVDPNIEPGLQVHTFDILHKYMFVPSSLFLYCE